MKRKPLAVAAAIALTGGLAACESDTPLNPLHATEPPARGQSDARPSEARAGGRCGRSSRVCAPHAGLCLRHASEPSVP